MATLTPPILFENYELTGGARDSHIALLYIRHMSTQASRHAGMHAHTCAHTHLSGTGVLLCVCISVLHTVSSEKR